MCWSPAHATNRGALNSTLGSGSGRNWGAEVNAGLREEGLCRGLRGSALCMVLEKVWWHVSETFQQQHAFYSFSTGFQDFQMRYKNNPPCFAKSFFFLFSVFIFQTRNEDKTSKLVLKEKQQQHGGRTDAVSRAHVLLFLNPVHELTFPELWYGYSHYSTPLPQPNALQLFHFNPSRPLSHQGDLGSSFWLPYFFPISFQLNWTVSR